MRQRNYQRPPFHPYGFASTGRDTIAFIRIPKNASSSFVASFELKDWTHVSALEQQQIYCALRDPVERFLSSVVETTMRARLFQDSRYFGDIVIDPAIYFDMQRLLRVEAFPEFLTYMIDVIEHTGPLDAHHERQVRFLEDFECRLNEIAFFDVAQADTVISDLLKQHGGNKVDANRLRDEKRTITYGSRLKTLKQAIKHALFAKSLSPRHLILPSCPGEDPPRFRSEAFNKAIVAFSRSIHAAATEEIRHRIAALYEQDSEIHRHVAKRDGFTHISALP
jgi:hypothetical protein